MPEPPVHPGTAQSGDKPPEPATVPGLAGWVRDYADDLRRFLAKRRLIQSDINDVCQEVYLRLLRFDRAEVVQNPAAYLFRVAANVAHDFRLRQTQWAPLESQHIDDLVAEPTPEDVAEAGLRRQRLLTALAALPPPA